MGVQCLMWQGFGTNCADDIGKTAFLSLEEAVGLWRNRKMSKPKKLGMPAPIPRTPERISCVARKRQNIGNGLLQATIGWNVWNRNGWNVKRRL